MFNFNIKISLRSKLMLMSISVLIIPYIGFDYIRQTETYLRSTLESTLTNVSYVVASALNNKPRLFSTSFSEEKNVLYVHELNNVIQIDGYTIDWKSYANWFELYQSISLANKDNFKLTVSKDSDYYYVLLQVEDNELIFSTRSGFSFCFKNNSKSSLSSISNIIRLTNTIATLRVYSFAVAI